MQRYCVLLVLIIVLLAGIACAEELHIVCTSFPCYDAARFVAGEEAQIDMLLKPGSEVHTYDPTPADILSIADADLFVYVGGESDAWVEDILDSFGEDAPETLRLFECVEARFEETVEGMTVSSNKEEEEYDEHIWTSPVNEMKIVRAVGEALERIDPAHAGVYSENAQSAVAELETIDKEIRSIIENAKRREIIVADRFPLLYFVREYGLDYCAAFPSCAAESEPSAKTVMYLIDRIRQDGIPLVCILEMSSGRTAETIASETGVGIETWYSIQNISNDDFEAGENYLSLMRRNIEVLKRGLM